MAYAFYAYFVRLHDFGPPMYWGSAVAGLFVVAVIAAVVGIVTTHRERKMLLDAVAGTPPADGQWVGVSGTIQSISPLTAPLTGQRAVAYEYKISRDERIGKSTSDVVYYDGKALAPCTIATRQGSVRLLSVPDFTELEAAPLESSATMHRASEYIRQTSFTIYETSKKRRTRLEEEWTDDDGQYRHDRQHFTREVDLRDRYRYQEKLIGQGEQVCAFGLYSSQRGGLIPHPNWAKQTRVLRGNPSRVADQLRGKMIKSAISAVVFSALAYGIVWLYHYQVANLPR